jgi:hypothetical protein
MRIALPFLLLVCGCGFVCMPPTSSVQVVDAVPSDSFEVGVAFGTREWIAAKNNDCQSPPEDVLLEARRNGADFLLVTPNATHDVPFHPITKCRWKTYAAHATGHTVTCR